MMEASLYDKIMDQQRLEPEFFRVGFYGKKFPFFLRVKNPLIKRERTDLYNPDIQLGSTADVTGLFPSPNGMVCRTGRSCALRPLGVRLTLRFLPLLSPLQNKEFVCRGHDYERLEAFQQRMLNEFPHAIAMQHVNQPDQTIYQADAQCILAASVATCGFTCMHETLFSHVHTESPSTTEVLLPHPQNYPTDVCRQSSTWLVLAC